MAQSGYSKILIYGSGTTGNTPSASNMTNSSAGAELAINYADGILFYKNGSGTVTKLATASTAAGNLPGGTAGVIPYQSAAGTTSFTAAGASGQYLISGGTGSPTWATISSTLVSSFSGGSTGLTPNSATTGAITLGGTLGTGYGGTGLTSFTSGGAVYATSSSALTTGTLPVASGGSGVTVSTGASSNVLRDANANITANAFFSGTTTATASGTQIVLTAASTPIYVVTGSGGQTIKLPDATTLPSGAIFSFNNNQTSGAITVNNNSNTLVASVPVGGYTTVVLLTNATVAGTWDRHDQAPSNVSWSTNTFDYPGSITSATWNGTTVAVNRGGTGITSLAIGALPYGAGTSAFSALAIGTAGQFLQVNSGATAPQWTTTLGIANGGTGQTTASAAFNALSPITTTGDLIIGTGSNTAGRLAIGTNGYVLTSNGTTASWAAVSVATATNLSGGATGSVPYQSGASTTTFLAGNTSATPNFYTSTGTGSAAQAPTLTSSTGSGSVVLATSPTLVTPALGTPSALVGTNITGTAAGLSIGGNAATATTATNQSGGTVNATSITNSGLTSGRVVYTTTGGLETTSANLTFDGSTVTALNTAYTGTLTGGTGVVNLGSGQFYKDASGNVGIGTSSPATTLDISVASASTQVSSTTSTNRVFSRVVNGSGNFYFAIDGATGGLFGGAAYARTIYGDGAYPMVFYTNANERMRIDSSGNVGIGTTTSGARLVISGGSLPAVGAFNLGISSNLTTGRLGTYDTGSLSSISNSSDAQSLEVSVGSSAGYYAGMSITGSYATLNSGTMRMFTAGAERMRIDFRGNVGIGTTSPSNFSGYTTLATNNTTGAIYEVQVNGTATGRFQASSSEVGLYQLTANPLTLYTNNQERMRIDSSGNLLVGVVTYANQNANGTMISPSNGVQYGMHASGSASGSAYNIFSYNGSTIGSIAQTGTTAVLYNTTSDYRLKNDATPIQNALATVEALNPVSFTWIDGRKDDGFLAHEIQAVIPNCVTGEKDAVNEDGTPKYQQMDSSGVIPFLVKAIQELKAEIDLLKGK